MELEQESGPRADADLGTFFPGQFQAADAVVRVCRVQEIVTATLAAWGREGDTRPLHLLDVRGQAEFAACHVPGAVSAPGGQLVECADNWIGVRGGRIVALDDNGISARMAAGWL